MSAFLRDWEFTSVGLLKKLSFLWSNEQTIKTLSSSLVWNATRGHWHFKPRLLEVIISRQAAHWQRPALLLRVTSESDLRCGRVAGSGSAPWQCIQFRLTLTERDSAEKLWALWAKGLTTDCYTCSACLPRATAVPLPCYTLISMPRCTCTLHTHCFGCVHRECTADLVTAAESRWFLTAAIQLQKRLWEAERENKYWVFGKKIS